MTSALNVGKWQCGPKVRFLPASDGVRAWLARMKARPSFKAAYYSGSLLSKQYPGIREEHQRKRVVALGETV